MVEAGFEKRIMFGSDQMIWPGTIDKAIESVERAPFLTQSQKRDILYNNAARFLRLSNEEIKRDHGKIAAVGEPRKSLQSRDTAPKVPK
jgi:hypothetical protein